MDFLPLFHNLKGRRCLIVGGGEIALRKARMLHGVGADLVAGFDAGFGRNRRPAHLDEAPQI